jgi:hypothetical protein
MYILERDCKLKFKSSIRTTPFAVMWVTIAHFVRMPFAVNAREFVVTAANAALLPHPDFPTWNHIPHFHH